MIYGTAQTDISATIGQGQGGDKMKNRCKYCGAKAKDVCTHCQEKMAIIKRIKSMLK